MLGKGVDDQTRNLDTCKCEVMEEFSAVISHDGLLGHARNSIAIRNLYKTLNLNDKLIIDYIY